MWMQLETAADSAATAASTANTDMGTTSSRKLDNINCD